MGVDVGLGVGSVVGVGVGVGFEEVLDEVYVILMFIVNASVTKVVVLEVKAPYVIGL